MKLDERSARALGRELLRVGGRLASRAAIADDATELAEIAQVLAEGLQTIEGALGRVVLARPTAPSVAVVAGTEDDGCGASAPPCLPVVSDPDREWC